MLRRWLHLDLLTVSLLAVLTYAIVTFGPIALLIPLRIFLGFLIVLLLPGYALASLLFPRRVGIGGVDRLVVCLGLSIAVTPILGIILSSTPQGITTQSLIISELAIVIVASLLASLRRQTLPPTERFAPLFDHTFSRLVLLLVVALIAVFGSIKLLQPKPKFTALYLLNTAGQMGGYPSLLRPGQALRITAVVENREGRQMSYELRVQTDPPIRAIEIPTLAPGDRWQSEILVQAPTTAGEYKLPLELYRAKDLEPYRTVHLNLTVTEDHP